MGSDTNIAKIVAGGMEYSAWQTVMVQRDFGNGVSVFSFSPVEGAYGTNNHLLQLDVGDPVQIYLSGQLALTGVIQRRSASLDKDTKQVVITGRSTTGYAVDSSVKVTKGTYNGYSLAQTANAILKPLGINLTVSNGGEFADKPFEHNVIHYGETIAENITRLAAARGLFISDDVNGNLIASKKDASSSGPSATFSEGVNIIRAHATMQNDGVAGSYQGVSSTPGKDSGGPPRAFSASLTQPAGVAQVFSLFVSEHPLNSDELKARVEHEAAVSAWNVFDCSIDINGWLNPSGKIWDPTTSEQVTVYSPSLFPKSPWTVTCGIKSAIFKQSSDEGSITTLELTLPNLLSGTATSGATVNGGAPSEFGNVSDPSAKADPPDNVQT